MNYSYISCQRSLLVIYFNSVLCFVFMTEDTCDKDGFYLDRNKLNCNFLHPHLSVLNIVFDRIQNLLCIGDSQNFEIHIPEVDRVEGVVLPGDDDGVFVDRGADFEADAIVREEGELGGVPDCKQ